MINNDSWGFYLVKWACCLSSCIATSISFYDIIQHLRNYRKPYEQRLIIRILLVVPIFSCTCLIAVLKPTLAYWITDPIREVYEAFIIFTFFSLLTLILGGERRIVTELSLPHGSMRHPILGIGRFLKPIDLSDPVDFLRVKKGILQYVWFKPLYCISLLILQVWDSLRARYVLFLFYNISVTWSLYNLALFWVYFASDLRSFHPWSKFLCVKLIIFASYWQSMLIEILIAAGLIGTPELDNRTRSQYSYTWQNIVLCLEMIFFAIFHVTAFPWKDYSYKVLPKCGRMQFIYAIRDTFYCYDVKWDFKHTLLVGSEYYTYQNFDTRDSNGSLLAGMSTESRLRQLQKGFRFTNLGSERYDINSYGSIRSPAFSNTNDGSSASGVIANNAELLGEEWDNSIGELQYRLDDPNYPVIWDVDGHRYTEDMTNIRDNLRVTN